MRSHRNTTILSDGKNWALSPSFTRCQVKTIAVALWRSLDRVPQEEEPESWLQRAINHPAGKLAEFWLHSLSLWRQQQEPKPKSLDESYRSVLTEAVDDSTTVGCLAKSVIASQFAFLMSADSAWAIEHLIPLFSGERGAADFQAVWDGFLYGSRLTPAVAERLEPSFLIAAGRVETELLACNDRFVEMYTSFLVHYAGDVVTKWIPALLKSGSEKTRGHFAWSVEAFLRTMDAAAQLNLWQRWLKEYWGNRVLGVPTPLAQREVESMLGWLPHLSTLFGDAVDIAIRMPAVPLKHSSLIHELAESNLPLKYSEATARLLLYLGKSDTPAYIWQRGAGLISKLLSTRLPENLALGLRELAARFGLALDTSD